MKQWLSGAGNVIAEVVAPTLKTPLESFKRHWSALRNFYIDQKNDMSLFPTHLQAMVQLVLEEDDERPAAEGAGPCLEFMMHNKIMETLCALCLIDKPTGVRRLILTALNSILGSVKIPLIPHASVFQPLSNLIAGLATMQLAGELVDALALIKTCLQIVARDPTLCEFFLVLPSDGRQGGPDYAIWMALVSLFKRTSPEQRERIEELVLLAINTSNDHVLDLMMRAEFHIRLVEDLMALFAQLPKVMPNFRTLESEQVYRYKLHVRFCNSLTSPHAGLTKVPNLFSDSLLLALEENFLEKAMVPLMEELENSNVTRDTLIAKETLQLVSGPLQDAFVSLTVGLQATALRDNLSQRILSCDSALSVATMRWFDVVCGLYHAHATESLMLAHIKTQPITEGSGSEEEVPLCVFEPILNSFPATFTQDRVSGSSLDSYTLHSRAVFAQIAAVHAASGIAPDNERCWQKFDSERGVFLDAVLGKLRTFSSMTLKECLLATSLISRILKYPSRPLYECLSHATLEVVAMIAAEMELQSKEWKMKDEDLAASLEKAYIALSSLRDFELDVKPDDLSLFFQRLVVLDEFVKELVAIDSARKVSEIETVHF